MVNLILTNTLYSKGLLHKRIIEIKMIAFLFMTNMVMSVKVVPCTGS